MPIIDNQQRLARAGRIRMGERRGNRPVKLDNFRITSANKRNLEQVQKVYGGTVEEWNPDNSEDRWQVTITSDEIDILIPMSPGSFSDWYEMWTAGGLKRRCDGQYDELNEEPCKCIPGQRDCKPYTRLNVWLPQVETLGVWLLTSTGYNSNAELGGVVTAIQAAAQALGRPIKATMRLDQRKRVSDGQTHRFSVPVIEAREPVAALLEVSGPVERLALPARPEAPALDAPPPGDHFGWPEQSPDDEEPEHANEGDRQFYEEKQAAEKYAAELVEQAHVEADGRHPVLITAGERQKIMINCRKVGIDDDARHDIISHVTNGRSQSIKDVHKSELAPLWNRLTTALSIKTAPLMREIWPTNVLAYPALHAVAGLEANVKEWGFAQWLLAHEHCAKLIAEAKTE